MQSGPPRSSVINGQSIKVPARTQSPPNMIGVNGDACQYSGILRQHRNVLRIMCERITSVDLDAADSCPPRRRIHTRAKITGKCSEFSQTTGRASSWRTPSLIVEKYHPMKSSANARIINEADGMREMMGTGIGWALGVDSWRWRRWRRDDG